MHPAFIGNIGTPEIIVILVIALLLFGRRLPEVGRSLGRGIVEFKKGVKGIEDDIDVDYDEDSRSSSKKVDRIPGTSPSSSREVDLGDEREPEREASS